MAKATDDALSALHGAIADELARKISDGSATAADLAVARQFLKDNGISAVNSPSTPLGNLVDQMPDDIDYQVDDLPENVARLG